jgi:hypothetical protein
MIAEMLKERNLPEFRSREEMIDLLLKNEYGYFPDIPYEVSVSEPVNMYGRYCDSTVMQSKVEMTITTEHGSHTFPIYRVLHKQGVNPFVVYLGFGSNIPSRGYPCEEIADNGFALCAKLQRMNVDALIPPTVAARTFEEVDRTIPVYVPDEVVSAYQTAPVWQEFNVQGKSNAPAAVDNIQSPTTSNRKLLRDGQLLIIRDGKTYNAMGQEL